LGVYGYSAATLISAQNADNIERVEAVTPAMVAAQIEAVVAERRPAALKTGALLTAETVKAVAGAIKRLNLPGPVVDPVLIASSGTPLLDQRGETALCHELIPLASAVTPNIPEAERLSGIAIDGPEAMRAAAAAIHRMGSRSVVIKGGHPFSGARPDLRQMANSAADVFYDGKEFIVLEGERVEGASLHGSGCIFSAAIAGYLARGSSLIDAIRDAKKFITRAMRNRVQLGNGAQIFFR
ncbi:MAG: bifunctional hydroxymethylpyrimidine kinase/phosphomethylpyrimidine kinase, partial [Candidatus Binataceae bacterium]